MYILCVFCVYLALILCVFYVNSARILCVCFVCDEDSSPIVFIMWKPTPIQPVYHVLCCVFNQGKSFDECPTHVVGFSSLLT